MSDIGDPTTEALAILESMTGFLDSLAVADPPEGPKDNLAVADPPEGSKETADLPGNNKASRVPGEIPDCDFEEPLGRLGPGGYCPVYIGDVYMKRYRVVQKLGVGNKSTVWLVRDTNMEDGHAARFRAMKVLTAVETDSPRHFEYRVLQHLKTVGPEHRGHKYITHVLDTFYHQSPNGIHRCMIFPLRGQNMVEFLFHGPRNINVRIRDHTIVERWLRDYPPPVQDREAGRYWRIPSRPIREFLYNDDDPSLTWDVTVGGWGESMFELPEEDRWQSQGWKISAAEYRPPEILIGARFGCPVDIWCLGVAFMDMFRRLLVYAARPAGGTRTDRHYHFAEIISYHGPFKPEFLKTGQTVMTRDHFEEDGSLKFCSPDEPRPAGLTLDHDEAMYGMEQADREMFLNFVSELMQVDPHQRPSAKRMLEHPWLTGGGTVGNSNENEHSH